MRSRPDEAPDSTRGPLRLLADPSFGLFVIGGMISTAGIWAYNIVAAILAFEISGSAFMVGLVSVCQFAPQVLFGLQSGAMADRVDRRLQLVAGRLLVALGSGLLAVWMWLPGSSDLLQAWPILVSALVVGLGFVVITPAQNALVPALARPGELSTAIDLTSLPMTLGRAIGPGIGAVMAVSLGPGLAFATASLTNLAYALIILRIRLGPTLIPASGMKSRVRASLAQVRSNRALTMLLVGISAIGLGCDPVVTLAPSLAARLGSGSALVGTLASAFGTGAVLAYVVLFSLRRWFTLQQVGAAGLLMLSMGIAAAGISWTSAMAIISLGFAGVGMTLSLTSLTTQIHQHAPEELRGRIMALWSIAFIGIRPIAAVVNGLITDFASPVIAFSLTAGAVSYSGWLCRPARLARYSADA